MHERNLYLNRITPFIDKPVIKIITGMRRVGKSCFLKLIINHLEKNNTAKHQIVYINKESLEYDFIRNHRDLYEYAKKEFNTESEKKYLFIDEIQEIETWERAVNSIFSEGKVDIFITGSNARLLSSELATLLSGRFVEFHIFSLGFQEYIEFREEKTADYEKLFREYLKFGGFPAICHFNLDEETIYQYVNGIYNTILLKDVVKRNSVRNVSLLDNLTRYIFDNVGNIFSAKKITDYLKSQKMKVGIETVQNYLSYLSSTYAIHKVSRYDLKGKRILELHEKYYLGDIGLRHALLGFREADISGILENIVFLELKRRGYRITIGKAGNREIDFIAEKEKKRIYLQVAYMLHSRRTIDREFSVLKQINDNYPKYVVSMDTLFGNDFEGIQRINLIDFLLNPDL
ncbi:MAG: ATP-binding protein [Desulfobacterales bacterium]|uniref:ATP-binding protein n=1 Tax=Candidatus Desulfatibia vada TaxID=2841696 RepID=A0A8J6P8W1_9BACT|nr:ATP-binding protein [Candidatus Desulfatibia vada]MBL6972457.1 ATP-binding protein [Desulfobacterales bacterium]